MQIKLTTLVLAASTVSALQITSPSRGDNVDLSDSNDITWDSVDSDPTSFDIQLVNEHVNPPITKTIATNVQTSAGSYTFSNLDASAGKNYQINFVSNDDDNTGILAQSAQFNVEDASGSTTSSTSSSSTSTDSASRSSSTNTNTNTNTHTTTTATSSSSGVRGAASSTAAGSKTAAASATHDSGASSAAGVSVSVSALGGVLGSVFALLV